MNLIQDDNEPQIQDQYFSGSDYLQQGQCHAKEKAKSQQALSDAIAKMKLDEEMVPLFSPKIQPVYISSSSYSIQVKEMKKCEQESEGMFRCSNMPLPSKLKLKHIIQASKQTHEMIQTKIFGDSFIIPFQSQDTKYLTEKTIQNNMKTNIKLLRKQSNLNNQIQKDFAEIVHALILMAANHSGALQICNNRDQPKVLINGSYQKLVSQKQFNEFLKQATLMAIQYQINNQLNEKTVKPIQYFKHLLVCSQDDIQTSFQMATSLITIEGSEDVIRDEIQQMEKKLAKKNDKKKMYQYQPRTNIESALLWRYKKLKSVLKSKRVPLSLSEKEINRVNQLNDLVLSKARREVDFYPTNPFLFSYYKTLTMISLPHMYSPEECLHEFWTCINSKDDQYSSSNQDQNQNQSQSSINRDSIQQQQLSIFSVPTKKNVRRLALELIEKIQKTKPEDINDLVQLKKIIQSKFQNKPLQSQQKKESPSVNKVNNLPNFGSGNNRPINLNNNRGNNNGNNSNNNRSNNQQNNQQNNRQPNQQAGNMRQNADHPNLAQQINQDLDQKFKRVLSIDGGGIKGIVALYFLAELQAKVSKPVYKMFDFFVGTSIGGLICLAFALKKFTAESLLRKMLGSAKDKIFSFSIKNLIVSGVMHLETKLQQFLREQVCMNFPNQLSLCDPDLLDIMITTCTANDGNQIKPHLFVKYTKENGAVIRDLIEIKVENRNRIQFNLRSRHENIELWKILRATSAAYPYFKPILIGDIKFYDGGFYFNNPSLLAYQFLKQRGQIPVNRIRILSIGLEQKLQNPEQNVDNFELIPRFNFLSDLLHNPGLISILWKKKTILQTMNEVQAYITAKIKRELNENYIRVEPLQEFKIELDANDYNSIRTMLCACQFTLSRMEQQQSNRNNHISFSRVIRMFKLNDNNLPSLSIRRFKTRYQIYQEQKCYKALDNLFSEGVLKSINSKQKLAEALQKFQFDQFISKSQKIIARPTFLYLFNRSVDPLSIAVSIGHYKSIKELNSSRLQQMRDSNNWNPFHFAFANDQPLSLSCIIRHFLRIGIENNAYHQQQHNLVNIVLKQGQQQRQIALSLNKLRNKIINQQTTFTSWTPKDSSKDYSSYKTDYFMRMLSKYLRDRNFDIQWFDNGQ